MIQAIQNVDESILLFIQDSIRNGILTPIMVFLTTIGNVGAVWLALGLVLMLTKKYRRIGFTLIFSIALAWCVNEAIKNIVCRPRPFETVEGLMALVKHPTSWSFPSGHTCASFAAAYALTREFGKRGAWFYVLAALISLSRMYVGVHYTTDVLVGMITGTLGGVLAYWIRYKWIRLWRD